MKKINGKAKFYGRSYRNYNKQISQNQLEQHDWTGLLDEKCPNKIWKEMIEVITLCINDQCPLKEFNISKVKEPWITPELLEFTKDKDMALRKAKKSKSQEDG